MDGVGHRSGHRLPTEHACQRRSRGSTTQFIVVADHGAMTQIDIAPTVMGLLGLPYEAPFFGVDVLHAPRRPSGHRQSPK
jgi:hypothetical protein